MDGRPRSREAAHIPVMTTLTAIAQAAAILRRFESGDLRPLVLAEARTPDGAQHGPSVFASLSIQDGKPAITARVVWFNVPGVGVAHADVMFPSDRLPSLLRPPVTPGQISA